MFLASTMFSSVRLACQGIYRLLELSWIYMPVLPLACLAHIFDTYWRFPEARRWGFESWIELWWAFFLQRIQRSGPVFVKFGQWAATRPDLIPQEWCNILGSLHDGTDPHSLEHTHRVMNRAFSGPVWCNSLFIEPQPIGSGCIAQVYAGYLVDVESPDLNERRIAKSSCMGGLFRMFKRGKQTISPANTPIASGHSVSIEAKADSARRVAARKVAVKIVHPQVRRAVDIDLKFLILVAYIFEQIGLDHLGASLALRQFASFLGTQIDLRVEAQNMVKMRAYFEESSLDVVVPKVYSSWVSRDALVMDFEDGEVLSSLMNAGRESESLKVDAWKTLCDACWAMIFRYRFFHGDLHPGNLLWRRKQQGNKIELVLLDCGLVNDLSGQAGEDLSEMVRAFIRKSPEEVARMLIPLSTRVGGREEDVYDPDGFVKGIADLIREGKACKFKLSKLNAGSLMGRSLLLGRRHRVRFDARFVNLGVSVIICQGVAMKLNGEGDMLSRMRHYLFEVAVTELGVGLSRKLCGGGTSVVASDTAVDACCEPVCVESLWDMKLGGDDVSKFPLLACQTAS
eukprot:TRINITY_DN76437_c0_g1_i1.p1 TRINITY_DN76437_c0_g1~~TRINITY_DN76437_c0_g1_i1.p1  ORF type:complete len:570 (-),score=65.25 TRINITY_DN76437_c0_g1_i1:151-1860(-)